MFIVEKIYIMGLYNESLEQYGKNTPLYCIVNSVFNF